MSQKIDLLIKNATIAKMNEHTQQIEFVNDDIGIFNGKITNVTSTTQAQKTLNAKGLHLLPGAIDTQVHFRDPGFPEKETIMSGSRAAVKGGVTSYFEMPNTKPPTLSAIDLQDKLTRAEGKSWANYAFYMGASPANADRLAELENLPGTCGVKMFMGSSTGNLLVGQDSTIETVLKNTKRRIAVHSEDDDRLNERKKIVLEKPGHVELHPVWRDVETAVISTTKIINLARKLKRKVHVLHVTSAEEVEILIQFKDVASFEVTPQHLTLSAPECYERLGTFAQMNPPIRDARHKEALWHAVNAGHATVLGSDHAPHTREEKMKTYPESPSGMTGVQTILPIMLHHAIEERLKFTRLIELLCHGPARLFGMQNKGEIREGYDADLCLVDLKAEKTITNSWIESTCGWTPYDGMKLRGAVVATIVNGEVAMRDDQLLARPNGKMIKFNI